MNFSFESSQIAKSKILKTACSLQPYIERLNVIAKQQGYDCDESSLNLPFDEEIFKSVHYLKDELATEKLKYIIVIGIGGSNLGAKAIYSALKGFFDVIEPERFPKIIFLDTNDSSFLHKVITLLSSTQDTQEVLINAISKSGKTIETAANLEILINKFPEFKSRLVVTTDEKSILWNKDINRLGIPDKVGGRFSVFSPAGLFPVTLANIDIMSLLEGAMKVRGKCLQINVEENPAALSASITFLNWQSKRSINDNFFFHSELEDLGKWYRQLTGESLGKNKTGVTPTVSIGSTDLHSMGQLYLGGKADKFFTFIWAQEEAYDIKVAKESILPELVPEIRGRSAKELKRAILRGVKESYRKNKLPFTEVILDNISESSIGEFMQFKMIETMLVAKLFGVNAFDQPNVEQYKLETKIILNQN